MLQDETTPEKRKPSAVTVGIGVVVVATIAVSLWALFKAPESKPSPVLQVNVPATMSPEEQLYAKTIRVENIALSRAENFIHQEVTILNAELVNAGPQPVQRLTVTVEFTDDMHQVVLRESRGVMGSPPSKLAPGERRSFQMSFDRVPASWNMQQPTVQVSYLQLAPLK
jgi:hypothetical protein